MKILAVIGARKNGNTSEIVNYIERIAMSTEGIDFEYLYLQDYPVDFCTGCHNCIFYGEDTCPHFETVNTIEEKMIAADGVILASPGYMFSVTGRMKNFLDHVAYNCHRPKYFYKKMFLVSACTKWQEKGVFIPLETWAGGAGFTVTAKVFAEMLPFPLKEAELDKTRKKIERQTELFLGSLASKRRLKPGFGDVIVFHAFRTLAKLAPNILKADMAYFRSKNAYDAKTRWYTEADVSPLLHRLASSMEKRIAKSVSNMLDEDKLPGASGGYYNKLFSREIL